MQGLTPLHYAADRNFLKIATILLDNGASIDAQDTNDGNTPITLAAICDNRVRFLKMSVYAHDDAYL